jgi:hypothetical protein
VGSVHDCSGECVHCVSRGAALSPRNLETSDGPLTTVVRSSGTCSSRPILRAVSVLPVPADHVEKKWEVKVKVRGRSSGVVRGEERR